MKKIEVDLKTLAKISKGTKRKKREINDLEIAEEIDALYKRCSSLDEVARLIRLSSEMVRQIKSLTTLEKGVKKLYLDGILRGYDIGYRILKLQSKDQIILAKHVVDKHLTSEDVRAIVRYKIDNPQMPIERVINKVIHSKDKKIYVAYLVIEKDTFEKLLEKNKNKSIAKILKPIFNKIIPNEFIVSFELNGRVVILKIMQEGLEEMRSKAKKLKVPIAKLADALVKEYLKGK